MARGLTPAAAAELEKDLLRPILLFEGEFASGTVRLWTGFGQVSWNGQTWIGGGTLVGVGEINETEEVVAQGLTVSMSGIAQEMVQIAIEEARQNRPGRVWLGFLTEAGEVIADPHQVFAGRLDVPEIDDDGESATVSITYENRLIDLRRPRVRRYTHEDQRSQWPADRGFEFVAAIQDMEIAWGRAGSNAAKSGGGGGGGGHIDLPGRPGGP